MSPSQKQQPVVPVLAVVVTSLGLLVSARAATAQTNAAAASPQAPTGTAVPAPPADPNPGAMTLTGSVDVLNQYMFRGIRQNSTGLAMWPAADLGIAAYSGTGGVKSLAPSKRSCSDSGSTTARTWGHAGSRASLTLPIKIGLSLGNYYEQMGTDHAFGFASVAGILTVPLGPATNFGTWNIHGGGEFQWLGKTTKALNGGHGTQAIGSIRIGFTY